MAASDYRREKVLLQRLRKFAAWVMKAHTGSLDGWEIQHKAVELGLMHVVTCDGTCANCEGVPGEDQCYRPRDLDGLVQLEVDELKTEAEAAILRQQVKELRKIATEAATTLYSECSARELDGACDQCDALRARLSAITSPEGQPMQTEPRLVSGYRYANDSVILCSPCARKVWAAESISADGLAPLRFIEELSPLYASEDTVEEYHCDDCGAWLGGTAQPPDRLYAAVQRAAAQRDAERDAERAAE